MSGRCEDRAKTAWAAAALVLGALAGCSSGGRDGAGPDPTNATYIGGATCAACHAKEAKLWRGSHHDLAMQPADSGTVLGDFGGATYRYAGVTSTFFRRGGAYWARTDGPDGKPTEFRIRYTFGVAPLQQYLAEFPGGRLQALSIAWDTRPASQGGQRWFHLYPTERISHGDEIHWTGPQQNWNFMCADCHSTDLKRNYDPALRIYRTTWSEIDVSCEACHGPGSAHVAWARRHRGGLPHRGDRMGLAVSFREGRGGRWTLDPATGNARPRRTGPSTTEIEMCAPCHSRRTEIAAGFRPGQRFFDYYLPALLDTTLYYPDGQQREEVYVWGSFLESRMYHAGVTCSDCHDPHSGRLGAEGNGLCAPCHAAAKYDATAHHGHRPDGEGGRCVACHMPERTYMVIDRRADHSLRVPRPDLTVSLGVPNPCQGCHADRPARWAAEAVARWHPSTAGFQRFALALAGARGDRQSQMRLAAVLGDSTQPEIARAAAAGAVSEAPGPEGIAAARRALGDPSPWVRATAITALRQLPLPDQVRLLPRLLEDPFRIVRIEAARALASVPTSALTTSQQAALEWAAAEYVAAQRLHADRPEHRTNLGTFLAQRGQYAEAEGEFRVALELAPGYVPAWANFADMRRVEGRDRDAEALLREGLRHAPAASLHHALGLALVRLGRTGEAIPELSLAARLDPSDAGFAYAYALALHSTGRTAEALNEIERALRRNPGNLDLLVAGATIGRDAGDRARALRWAERLIEIDPSDPGARQLLEDLRGGAP